MNLQKFILYTNTKILDSKLSNDKYFLQENFVLLNSITLHFLFLSFKVNLQEVTVLWGACRFFLTDVALIEDFSI